MGTFYLKYRENMETVYKLFTQLKRINLITYSSPIKIKSVSIFI